MHILRSCTGLVVLLACLVGCGKAGPKIVPVSGTVSLDGAPLTEGVVGFVSASGYVSSASITPDGHFKLASQYGPGIPLGAYRVTVLPSNPLPTELSMQSKQSNPPSKIPPKYQYPDRSGLDANVDGIVSEFAFTLSTLQSN